MVNKLKHAYRVNFLSKKTAKVLQSLRAEGLEYNKNIDSDKPFEFKGVEFTEASVFYTSIGEQNRLVLKYYHKNILFRVVCNPYSNINSGFRVVFLNKNSEDNIMLINDSCLNNPCSLTLDRFFKFKYIHKSPQAMLDEINEGLDILSSIIKDMRTENKVMNDYSNSEPYRTFKRNQEILNEAYK